jgi:hypothetical protein
MDEHALRASWISLADREFSCHCIALDRDLAIGHRLGERLRGLPSAW